MTIFDEQPVRAYSAATAWSAEGARVGIVACETCGAAILVDPRDPTNRTQQHTDWHARHADRGVAT